MSTVTKKLKEMAVIALFLVPGAIVFQYVTADVEALRTAEHFVLQSSGVRESLGPNLTVKPQRWWWPASSSWNPVSRHVSYRLTVFGSGGVATVEVKLRKQDSGGWEPYWSAVLTDDGYVPLAVK